MDALSINSTVRLVLIACFAVAALLGAGSIYYVLHQRALARTELEAGRFLTTATAIRSYTDEYVGPALTAASTNAFYNVTIPAFAAQRVYKTVQASYPGYTYREPAFNPTNPDDRVTPEEVELIDRFRANPALNEVSGIRASAAGQVYYLARPIKATEDCLSCHDTPQRAPAAMVAKYGPNNGFGWHLGEIVAIQSLTIPVADVLRESGEVALTLVGSLLIIFVITYFVLTSTIDSLLVRPLQTLAQETESASLARDVRMQLPRNATIELRTLAAAIERLRVSLGKALRQISGSGLDESR